MAAAIPDRAGVFTPDGHYFTRQRIEVGKGVFLSLSIQTLLANASTATLRLQKAGKQMRTNSTSFKIEKGSSTFSFGDEQGDDILIAGKFTGSKGPLFDTIEAMHSVVFEGTITTKGKTSDLNLVLC